MNRARIAALVALLVVSASCGGGSGGDQPDSTDPDTTVITDPREYVRAQMAGIIPAYVASTAQQMPTVTSTVDLPNITSCVTERIDQLIESAQIQEGQPEGSFASMLLDQAQANLYGLVGICAEQTG